MSLQIIGTVEIEYGIDTQLKSRHTQHFLVDNYNEDMLGSPVVAVADPGINATVHSMHEYINAYCLALQEVCIPGILILGASFTGIQYDSNTGETEPLGSRAYQVTGFTPDPTHLQKRGPNGSMFFWAKQKVLVSGKEGGIHWGFISGTFAALPRQFSPIDVSLEFSHALAALTALSAPILTYVAPTKTLHTYTDYVSKSLPSSLISFGIVNG